MFILPKNLKLNKMKNENLTKKGTPRKNKQGAGRPMLYNEETIELRRYVPKSHFTRLETILDYELSKLKTKKP